jgi:EspG family
MIAAHSDNDSSTYYGFEISIDEAAYLMDHLRLGGLLPDVLALYNPMAYHDLHRKWNTQQTDSLTRRGILTPTGVLPEVSSLMKNLAYADETLAVRITPLQQPNTMLRVAIANHENRFTVASRTRDVFLVQPVAAGDWATAATKVLDAQLGTAPPAPLSAPVQLSVDDIKRIAARPPATVTDMLVDLGISEADAAILNSASQPDVATELTASRRDNGTTRRGKTAVTVLDTQQGRIIAWPNIGPDRHLWITYAEGSPHRLGPALVLLFDQLTEDSV